MNEPRPLPVPASMPTPPPPDDPDATPHRSRRQFLALCGLGAGGLAAARMLASGDASPFAFDPGGRFPPDGGAEPAPRPVAAIGASPDMERRALVIVELAGGNDGLGTLIPWGDGRIHDLRPDLLPAAEELVWLDDHRALHPALADLAPGLAILEGVGTPNPSGSHFEMEQRWWTGRSAGIDLPATGFLGRLCDALDAGAPVTGVSIGQGTTRALRSDKSVTLGIPDTDAGWYLTEHDKWFRNLRHGLRDLGTASGDDDLVAAARAGLTDALNFADVLAGLEIDREPYPGGSLSDQLATTAALLAREVGIRVFHVRLGGFDTHTGQRGEHRGLLQQFSGAVAAFRRDLERRGLAEEVLVATTSEFGRRPEQNAGGTDHGAASVALLAGPVVAGVHGEHLSLDHLDEHDNLVATATVEEYYATLAESWFGVPAGEVLTEPADPIAGIVA